MKVLITGAAGQVGRALVRAAPADAQVLALTRMQLDISDAGAVHGLVSTVQPDLIINAAAYTAVDQAETEPEVAYAINAQGPRHLAEAASGVSGCRLVQISSDYVFDGCTTQSYKPGDPTHPLNVYGRTKQGGEQAVREVLVERALIVRTAWVYASHGRNFVLTMLRLMSERSEVRVVADQTGTPTAAASMARALWRLTKLPALTGTLHWTDEGVATWYDFAQAIAQEATSLGLLSHAVEVVPITTADYPTAARRPAHSVLDLRDTAEKLGIQPVPWVESLGVTLREFKARGRVG
jgi:dTDP-4-dehydrorhamnose reductase